MPVSSPQKIPLWRDDRFWKVALQGVAVLVVLAIVSLLWHNISVNMARAGIKFGFDFLNTQASFAIGESLIPYQPNDSYARVLLVGLLNSLRVMIVGFVLTTVLGVAAGIARFSNNWLLRKGSEAYVEIVRNTPLLVQLFFWYLAVFSQFPKAKEPLAIAGWFFASKRGIFLPWPTMGPVFLISLGLLVTGAIVAFFLWKWRIKLIVEQGEDGQQQKLILSILAILAPVIILFGFGWQFPQQIEPGIIRGGLRLTLEFTAVLTGLVIYTGAFIAEVVRAGIQAVSKGQWEAANALGLQPGLTMRLVVFPQALRVIIPPLNSQYMNLAKNSSLAIAIAYPDIYSVSNTTYNQTGRPVEVMLLLMATYLTINLIISVTMNKFNQLVQIKER